METLRGVVEAVEGEFGEAIAARDDALAALADCTGLGPPDLAWLAKVRKQPGSGSSGGGWLGFGSGGGGRRGSGSGGGEGAAGVDLSGGSGYYHYVLGGDVSSSAALAAYFARLNRWGRREAGPHIAPEGGGGAE